LISAWNSDIIGTIKGETRRYAFLPGGDPMKSHRLFSTFCALVLIALAITLGACSARPQPTLSPVPAAGKPSTSLLGASATRAPEPTKAPAVVERVVEKPVEKVVQKPAAAAPTAAPPRAGEVAAARTDTNAAPVSSVRKIIKNGEMNLLVADTDRAIDQVTNIAVDSGGYIISSQTTLRGDVKVATLTLGVPVDQFEIVQRQLRSISLKVQSETASGKDVTDEFVDLQSRLLNLEATAARIREFLKQAQTVEEALKVNAQLTEIEGQINQVKGRMNFLADRSAFSTLLINLEPERPTPTPTPTPTVTATPTPTTTPTPVVWQPGETFTAATGTLGAVLRGLGDLLIWLVVLGGPVLVIAAIVAAIWLRSRRRRARG
jgi:hypothetical protein